VSAFFAAWLGAALAANSPMAASNAVPQKPGAAIPEINTNDPVENDYYQIMLDDDDAEQEIKRWMDDAAAFAQAGGSAATASLHLRIQQRLDGIKTEYEDFVERHPRHVNARLAFGSFLNDRGDDDGALAQWEAARQLAPTNPATWNNLGKLYCHDGRIKNVKKAFEYYEKAIQLNPSQPVYYHNLAAAVYYFRDEAREYYHLEGPQVMDKAQSFYRQAIKLDPANFVLLTDYAESFYGTDPPRWKEGLEAWSEALKRAPGELEKEGVRVHLANIHLQLGEYDQVRSNLDLITNINYAKFKTNLESNLAKLSKK
jgi:tetratricopeptide (TPR) repeat protein